MQPYGPRPAYPAYPPVPQQRPGPPGRIEVKVSYAGRIAASIAIGALPLLLSIYMLVSFLLSSSSSSAAPPSATNGGPCVHVLEGAASCTDRMAASGHDYRFSANRSGTYTFAAKDTSGAARSMCVRIEKNGDRLAKQCSEGAGVAVTAAIDLNTVDVHVEDAGTATTHPYTLTIARVGAKEEAGPDQTPLLIALLAFPALALVFIAVIPLVLLLEKRRFPRFIDPTGVTMRNGAHFPWRTFRGVRVLKEVRRSRIGGVEVGVELVFATGTAVVRYRPIVNKSDVMFVTYCLQQGRNPFGP